MRLCRCVRGNFCEKNLKFYLKIHLKILIKSQQVSIVGSRRVPSTATSYKAFLNVQNLNNNQKYSEKLIVALRTKNNFYGTKKFENIENLAQEVNFEVSFCIKINIFLE